jgi:3-phosphoglycerate kinase
LKNKEVAEMVYKIIEKGTEKIIATIDDDEINILDNVRFELVKEEKKDGNSRSLARIYRGNEEEA